MYLRYHAGRTIRHAGSAVLEGALVVGIAGALVFGVAVVGGGAPAGAGAVSAGRASIWIDESSYKSSTQLFFGQEVSFGYRSDTAQSIQLHCFQPVGSDNLVFATSRMLYEGGWGYGEPFNLGPSGSWTEGAATCKAMLGHRTNSGKYRVEASVTFDVAP